MNDDMPISDKKFFLTTTVTDQDNKRSAVRDNL